MSWDMRLGEFDEDRGIPRLPPSCAAVAPPGWGERATGRRSDLFSHSPPPTLTCQERALDPTGSAHLHSLGPRGSQRQPPASPEQPATTQVLPPWPRQAPPSWLRTAGRGASQSKASILRRPRPNPRPPLPVGAPLPLAELQSRQRRRRHCALLCRWEPAGLGPGRAARARCRGSRPPAVWAVRGRGRAGAWPGAAARRPGQHDRRQQHPQQRWAAALALAVLRALRAHPPWRRDPVLRLAAALA